jgi:hypothetical protein
MKTPPHLPPKSCSVSVHRKTESVLQMIVFVAIAFLAGITATLVAIAWIVPTYTPNTVIYSVDSSGKTNQERAIDPLFVRQQEKQIVNVYDKRQKVDGHFYKKDAHVGTGVMLTSDGWLALYLPSSSPGEYAFWEIIDYKGGIYQAEAFVFDPLANVGYVKVNGDGFFASSFVPKEYTKQFAFVWAIDRRNWQPSLIDDAVRTGTRNVYPVWEPQFAHALSENISPGSVLLSEDGKFAGFADQAGHLIDSFFVETQYTKIFDEKTPSYYGISLDGYMVDGVSNNGVWKNISGFYITGSRTKPTDNSVGAGDVVIRIEGKAVEEPSLAKQILSAPKTFSLTILRENEEIDILIQK